MDIAENRSLTSISKKSSAGKAKFFIGGLMIVAAVVFLIVSSLQSSSQYFLTVEELNDKGASLLGREVRVSGAVLGDSIEYDAETLTLKFMIAHTPGDQDEVDAQGGLAAVLHSAVTDPGAERLPVVYNGVMPDLLQNEAQAIMTGKVGEDGVFYAEELLLKCPTKYEEAVPQQSAGNN